MQLTKDLINVIDSDAHAKDDDESLKPFRCEPDEKMIGHIVSEFGSEMLLYASDYPIGI